MNQEAIWDYYQIEDRERFQASTSRMHFLAKQVQKHRLGAKVLNIGVGGGTFERAACKRGLEVHSLDPSDRAIELLREELGLGDRAKVGYSQAIPFEDGRFDTVVMTEVLEHLSDEVIDGTLKEVHRVLAPGGVFIGTVPAREDLKTNMVACPNCETRFHRWGHQQSFDAARLRGLLSRDFSVEEIRDKSFSFRWEELNWNRRLRMLIRVLMQISRILLPSTGSIMLYFRASKARG